MLDLFNMEEMLKHARIAEKIADGVVDDQAYNVVTQTVNEEVLMEAREEVEKILENGRKIKGDFNIDALAKEIDKVLPTDKSGSFAMVENAEETVSEESPEATETADIEECAVGAKAESGCSCKNPKCKGECKKSKPSVKKAPIQEGKTPAKKAPIQENNTTTARPAVGVDTVEKFLKAAPVSQKDFVDANTNKEHEPSASADKKEVDKNAEATQKEMVKAAEKNKKFEEVAKKQTEVSLTENIAKFKGFVEGIRNEENTTYVDAVIKGFDIIWK